jgi:hypothetical protein
VNLSLLHPSDEYKLWSTMQPRIPILPCLFLFSSLPLYAGMPAYDLNDVARLRLEDISFFAALLIVCALGIKLLWNQLAKGFAKLPRITFVRSLCLTGLLGLLMLLVLSMISGARELLTPGAWRRQGSTYRLNDGSRESLRRQSMEFLRSALRAYAEQHDGKYPPHEFTSDIPEKIWQAPDSVGTRYVYVSGLTRLSGAQLLACEPVNFGERRLVLFANGEITTRSTPEIRRALGTHNPAQ